MQLNHHGVNKIGQQEWHFSYVAPLGHFIPLFEMGLPCLIFNSKPFVQ
jgi:hypothetical protein